MPNLQQPEFMQVGNPAAPFISAFAAAAGISAKRRQLEEQMMKMQLANDMAEQRLDVMKTNASTAINRLQFEKEKTEQNAASDKRDTDRLIAMQHEVYDLKNQFKVGTDDYGTGLDTISDRYSDVSTTPEGSRFLNQRRSEHEKAAKAGAQSRYNVTKDFFAKVGPNGINVPPQSFALDGIAWGKNNDGSRYLDYELDANGRPVRIVPPNSREKGKNYKAKTLDENTFKSLMGQYNQVYDPNQIPDVEAGVKSNVHSTEWTRAKAVLNKGGDPSVVKSIYSKKGFDPSELDADSPP